MIMTMSESKKAANYKWNSENMKAVATYVRKETADEFKQACKKNGVSMFQVLKEFIENYISENK